MLPPGVGLDASGASSATMAIVMRGLALRGLIMSALLTLAATGRAQALSPAGPTLPVPMLSTGDPPRGAGSQLSPRLVSMPLRLSLQPVLLPVEPPSTSQPCESREEPSGNTFHGFPLQGYASLRLIPQLTLHGFTNLGCPTNGGIGTAVTYTATLRPDIWLVVGAGAYAIPHAQVGAPAQYDFHVDLMTRGHDDRVWSVGLGRKGVTFGGQW